MIAGRVELTAEVAGVIEHDLCKLATKTNRRDRAVAGPGAGSCVLLGVEYWEMTVVTRCIRAYTY